MSRMIARRSLFLLCVLGLFLSAQQSIAIDPPVPVLPYAQSAVLFASNGIAEAQFGHAIVAQENFAAISAPRQYGQDSLNVGEVYLFKRGPDGWEEIGRLPHPPGVQTDWFGGVLALDGDYLAVSTSIVSSPGAGSQFSNAVVVYQRDGDEWQLQSGPILPDEDFIGSFGYALALDGNNLAVSATEESPLGKSGVAIFSRIGQSWTQQAWIDAPPNIDRWNPAALSLHGDWLLVGSPYANDHGLVTIYRRTANTWLPTDQFLPEAGETNGFGSALDFDGETAAIAYCSHKAHDADNYVQTYSWDGLTWTLSATLPLTAITNEFQCDSVTLEGQQLVVSALKWADPHSSRFTGGAFLFQQIQDQWTLRQFLSHNNVRAGQAFGWSAALAGDEVLISALSENYLNAGNRGAVHVFSPHPAGSGTVLLPLTTRGELSQTEGLIVFQAIATGGAHDLFLSTAEGSGRTPLTQTPVNEFDPDWSPDGRSIVFVRDGEGKRRLVTLDIASGQTTIIGPPGNIIYSLPRWSPDGERIVFTDDWGGVGDIYVVDRNGENLTNLTNTKQENESMPDWSPDSAHLVYQTDDGLRIMDADGSNSHPLTGSDQFGRTPDWSPDGQTISYTNIYGDEWNLYTISAVGGVPVPILDFALNGRWSADSQSIVFNGTGGGLFRVILSTGEMTVISPDSSATHPVEQP